MVREKNREIAELNKELDRHIELLANKELQTRVDQYRAERLEEGKAETTGVGGDHSFG